MLAHAEHTLIDLFFLSHENFQHKINPLVSESEPVTALLGALIFPSIVEHLRITSYTFRRLCHSVRGHYPDFIV